LFPLRENLTQKTLSFSLSPSSPFISIPPVSFLSSPPYPKVDNPKTALEILIDEVDALVWDFPVQLKLLDEAPPNHEGFALIGKLLNTKPLHSQLIRATLATAWKFAAPLAVEVLAPNKFLFAVPLQSHVDRILFQGPLNIRGLLLLLQPWTPGLTIDEVTLHLYPF